MTGLAAVALVAELVTKIATAFLSVTSFLQLAGSRPVNEIAAIVIRCVIPMRRK